MRSWKKVIERAKVTVFAHGVRWFCWKASSALRSKSPQLWDAARVVVNNWLVRYEKEGIKGLATRAGRGRPPILSQQNRQHLQKVEAEIKKHPNSVKTVVAALAEDLDLLMHPETLKRYLKKTSIGSLAHERGSNHGSWLRKEKRRKSSWRFCGGCMWADE